MVYCGKPSKGCQTCRERKIRCDQAPDGCSQCARLDRKCPGYRDQLDLMFRNESTDVVRRAKAKAAKNKEEFAGSSTPVSFTAREIVRREVAIFPTFQPPIFSMAPTVEERATGFFFHNFVIGVSGPTRGYLDDLETAYKTEDLSETLLASMKSVGFAGYSHLAHAPELLKDARQEYMKALRLTNLALRSPKDVKKDSTLLAIMILGIFETVTGCNQRSLSAWAEHINGAAALVKLRGAEQLKTPTGRRMFIQVTSNLLVSCIQRRLALPAHIIELRKEIAKYVDTTDPAWRVQDGMIAFAKFRCQSTLEGTLDLQTILSKALELDGTFLEIFSDIPPIWAYKSVYTAADPDVIYDGRYDVYNDFWVAQLWNAMRTIRIILNEQIRYTILNGLLKKPPLFTGSEYTAQLQISTDVMYELATDVLASVPQHLGYISNLRNKNPTSSSSAVLENNNETGFKFLWTDFDESSPAFPWKPCDTLAEPMIRASGGYFLLWPLFLVGNMATTTEPMRQWVIKNLQHIGRTMGIQQALVLASTMERQEIIKVWEERQRKMSATDITVTGMDIDEDPDAD